MSAITPQYTESNLSGTLTQSIDRTSTTIKAIFVDRISGDQRTPQSSTKLFVVDKGSEQFPNDNYEIVLCTSHSTDSEGVTTLTGCTRGIAFYGTSLVGGTGNAHISGAEIGCADVHLLWTLMVSCLDGTNSPVGFKIGTPITFELSGILADRVFTDIAARDAAITVPVNGMSCYVTGDGVFYDYQSGSWQARANGSTPNAGTAVAGKVELATQSELDNGTATGGTGAGLVATPDILQTTLQKGAYCFGTTAGGTTAYTLTLTPAIAAYVTGMKFYVKMNATNTGASTLAVNGLSALTIKKFTGTDVASGDLPINSIVELIYDGTNLLILGITSPYAFLTAKGDLVVATAANIVSRQGVGSNNQVLIADSSQSTGVKWGDTPLTSVNYKNGLDSSRTNDAASGTQTIAHGLGKTPARVRITAVTELENIKYTGHSWGTFDASSQNCTYSMVSSNVDNLTRGSQASKVIFLSRISGTGNRQEASLTVDSTNLTLTWTKTGSGAGTGSNIFISWEVEG